MTASRIAPMNENIMQTEVIGVIPARWASTRFPGKPLHRLGGKALVHHVWDRCQEAKLLSRSLIATDDERIADAARAFGADVVMTRSDHPTGTDRIAEAIRDLPNCSHVINVQGDEPLIDPALIDQLAQALLDDPDLPMVTAANIITDDAILADPNVVKVVISRAQKALYFSRSLIPYPRSSEPDTVYYRHKGIYGYSRKFLLQFVQWKSTPLERTEQLEQLRALENGASIGVIITEDDSIGVDTPEQAHQVANLL